MTRANAFEMDSSMRLSEAISYLPDIKPRKALQKLKEWNDEIINQIIDDEDLEYEKAKISLTSGIVLTGSDFQHILYERDDFPLKITPYGSKLLIEIYKAKLFELKNKKQPSAIHEILLRYTESEKEILHLQALRREERRKQADIYKSYLVNPDQIPREMFTFQLLNDVFIEHMGLRSGSYSMFIGGFEVTKTVSAFRSNSGKSHDNEISFTWYDNEGIFQHIEKCSQYANNRRNDEKRNWGLPE